VDDRTTFKWIFENIHWIRLAQDGVQWRLLVDTVMKYAIRTNITLMPEYCCSLSVSAYEEVRTESSREREDYFTGACALRSPSAPIFMRQFD
jgi:hypothetical protein